MTHGKVERARMLLAVLIAAALGCWLAAPAGAQPAARAGKPPVILLTGFEPFGEGKPLNASWEGIKDLNGRNWQGYQLVCKQMQVAWGAPLQQLQEWLKEYQPVAVFSFGQGGNGCCAFECQACNERCDKKDNRGAAPPSPVIIADGPNVVAASAPCEKFAALLLDKGYLTCVSADAGRYLCGETLYCLEHLKATRRLRASVAFCHVPPLGTQVRGKEVTPAYVRQFVLDLLDAWYNLYPRQQEVKDFVERYFRTWSNGDMRGYDDCFLPTAAIQFIDSFGRMHTTPRKQFIAEQSEYQRVPAQRATEVAESVDVRFEGKLARVVVYWKLTAGPRVEKGYDHFTLVKQEGRWRIANLVFYADDK